MEALPEHIRLRHHLPEAMRFPRPYPCDQPKHFCCCSAPSDVAGFSKRSENLT